MSSLAFTVVVTCAVVLQHAIPYAVSRYISVTAAALLSLRLSRRNAVLRLRASRLMCAILKILILIDRLRYRLRMYNCTNVLRKVTQLFTWTGGQTDTLVV